ncbi:bifunctional DNA primase/polymerase [Streptomyces sp. 7-21]|mgnify:CR=1 FL=1|uniref:bifunctional DNA primase/polymerase n=1 Tax=Streptomyces sp. 7-21 TaxID=2802283 RepID=UPI00191ED2D4|nr:bifunctional DNA primase/polymerase [Streptomyces sp. 7-21]MBL1068384.1 bifunctional DNA primase/polymerase [Streptomyces sp. 7-21]
MGFTIGGIRELRRPRRASRAPGALAVAEYTGLWGWDVVPGARARRPLGRARAVCCCGDGACPAPGAHPLAPGLVIGAGTALGETQEIWADACARPAGATVLLPCGRAFDALEVPEAAGRQALPRLERLGVPLGPVARAPHGRVWFLVAPGAARRLPQLLYRTGWDGTALDIRGYGPGSYLTAPPSSHGGLGPVRWLRPPAPETAGAPPPARLLLGTLAWACHRAAAA